MRRILLTATLVLWRSTTLADDQALLLGVERYANLDRVNGAADITDAEDALKAVGFDVQVQANGAGADMTRRLTGFVSGFDNAERLVVGLSGAFVTDGDRTWLLPVDVQDPVLFNLAGAVSIESVLRVLAKAPGQAVLVLGSDTSANERYGPFTRAGMGNLDAPNGVTIVNGTARATANLMEDMAEPGADVMALVRESNNLFAHGFVPQSLVLVPNDFEPIEVLDIPEPTEDERAAEATLWEGA